MGNPSEIRIAIHNRIQSSKSKTPLLKYFDGATMASYRNPHKGAETEYCRRVPMPNECKIVGNYVGRYGQASSIAPISVHALEMLAHFKSIFIVDASKLGNIFLRFR